MFRFIKNVSITTLILFASYVFILAIFVPAPADAIIFTAPPRTIQTDDVTSATILDDTITGADISSSASTTMFRLQVSDLMATSTTATSTFAGGFTIETSGFVYDYSTNNVGIGETSPASKLSVSGNGSFGASYNTTAAPANGLIVEGNVGIGTITPVAKLQITGGVTAPGAGVTTTSGDRIMFYSDTEWHFKQGIESQYMWFGVTNLNATPADLFGFKFYATDSGATPVAHMTINGTGHVGIGTTTPFTKLAVTGTITTNNINATSTTATSTFSGGVKLDKAGTGIEFQNGSIQITAASTPAGSIIAYASTTAPSGWLLADGTSYATSTYPLLFDVIGYSYGGSAANFNVPDIQNRQITMASTTANIGQTAGEANHTLTTAEMPAHTHSVTRGSGNGTNAEIDDTDGGVQRSTTSGSTGGGGAHNVLDPYIVLNYIIKY